MARKSGRKKKQAVKLPVVGMCGSVVVVEMPNPYYRKADPDGPTNPRFIASPFNPRESYVGYLWTRKLIDEAQKRAGDRIRAAYERMGGSGASAIDYAREHVDGGQIAQAITDNHLIAASILRDSIRVLGPEGHNLVILIAGEGRWPGELFQDDNKRLRKIDAFKGCLDALSVHWGYKSRPFVARRA